MKPEEQHSVHRYFGDEVEVLDKLFKSKLSCLDVTLRKLTHTEIFSAVKIEKSIRKILTFMTKTLWVQARTAPGRLF